MSEGRFGNKTKNRQNKGDGCGGCKSLQNPLSVKAKQRGPLQLGDVGHRSKSSQINDLAAAAHTDWDHNSWWRRGRISVLCSILTTVQQEPRDSALGCTYTVKKELKGIWWNWIRVMMSKSSRGGKKNTSLKCFSLHFFLPVGFEHKVNVVPVDSKEDYARHKTLNDDCLGLHGSHFGDC